MAVIVISIAWLVLFFLTNYVWYKAWKEINTLLTDIKTKILCDNDEFSITISGINGRLRELEEPFDDDWR